MERVIPYICLGLMVIIAGLLSYVITTLYSKNLVKLVKGSYKQVKQNHADKMQKDVDKRMEYDLVDEMLLKKGIKYRMGENFSPFDYTMLRILVGLLLGLVGLVVHPLLVAVGVVAGYVMVPVYFDHEDKHDSQEMMDDIAAMFGIVSLQLKNGVFLSKVIYECYLNTEHPRLKKALLELSLEMEKFGSVKEAAISFRGKFGDKYLDTFSKTLAQADETGSAADLFKDIENQIDGINEAIAIREEQKVGNVAFLFQTLVFIAAMLFVVYIVIQMFATSWSIL